MSDVSEEKIEIVVEQMREDNIKFIRLQFVDINGTVKTIVIPLEDDKKAYLRIKFDVSNQTEENTNNCRVDTWFDTPKDFVLESGKEYLISEEINKKGKSSYKQLGKIRID